MFFSHLAEISLPRDEPHVDPKKEVKIIRRRNGVIAEAIVLMDLLKNPKKNPKALDKIRKLIEFDKRFQSTKEFMSVWNYWRDFYLELGPIMPKSRAQLTCIENIIDMAKEHEIDLNLFLGALHKTHEKRKFKPGFTHALAYGLEYYEQFSEQVMADIHKFEYESEALS